MWNYITQLYRPSTSPPVVEQPVPEPPTIVMSFSPLVDFFSPTTRSAYTTGLVYYVRRGNNVLTACVQQWVTEQKVKIVPHPGAPTKARISGKGVVS
jgi:hypothetical protein